MNGRGLAALAVGYVLAVGLWLAFGGGLLSKVWPGLSPPLMTAVLAGIALLPLAALALYRNRSARNSSRSRLIASGKVESDPPALMRPAQRPGSPAPRRDGPLVCLEGGPAERVLRGAVDAVSHMVALRDPYTSGHLERVGELSAAIAARMGLDEGVQCCLRVSGTLHDVGKVAVPSDLLSKPSRLSRAEFELVKSHADAGYEILRRIEFPWPVAEVVWQHHERMDGSGYPRGLRAEEILIEARILAIADLVDSMAAHRPYRVAPGIERALAELEANAGRLYDARATEACVGLLRDDGFALDAWAIPHRRALSSG